MSAPTPGVDPTRLDPYVVVALEKLAARESALIALDFDGCLAPLVDDPAEARPLPEAAAALEELSTAPDLDLALISGRPAADLIHLATPPANTWIIGSHGAEIGRVDGEGEFHQEDFALDPAEVELLEAVTAQLTEIAGAHADVWVEHKPAAAVLHTRQAQPEVGAAARAAALTGPGALDGVHPIEGNEVVEIAVVAATKGKALTKLRADVEGRRGAPVTVLYAGDDVTDETALATLKFSDVGIKVGHATTVARFWVTDPPAMAAALRVYVHQRRRRANRAETATGESAGDR
ncbi:MAG TPA: trehalose-phosphatase [Beutenbergiaceae bacterium]|nr:trehalose-phosphatase [Beutenbergiaceae bacterium]